MFGDFGLRLSILYCSGATQGKQNPTYNLWPVVIALQYNALI